MEPNVKIWLQGLVERKHKFIRSLYKT